MKEVHSLAFSDLAKMFSLLKKCRGKLDFLTPEMLFIRERKPKCSFKHTLVARYVMSNTSDNEILLILMYFITFNISTTANKRSSF